MARIVLSTPVVTEIVTSEYRFASCFFQVLPVPALRVVFVSNIGDRIELAYEGETAQTYLTALSTADLSQQDMEQRLLALVLASGRLAGTITE